MKRKVSFIFQAIWNNNKKLLAVSVIQILLLIILPYLQLFLIKNLVAGIEEKYSLLRYIFVVISILLLQIILTAVKEWTGATSEWSNKYLVNSFLTPLDQKTMCTDYENVEGTAGQGARQKALNAVYTSGQSVISKTVSFSANLLGLLFYGITVGLCNGIVLGIVIITTYAGYLLTKLLHKYEQKHKEDILKYSKKNAVYRK